MVAFLARPYFAIFDEAYEFTRRPSPLFGQLLPLAVQSEFLLALAMLPLLSVDLSRPYADFLGACDASPSYGFGASVAPCSSMAAQRLGRLAEHQGDYV